MTAKRLKMKKKPLPRPAKLNSSTRKEMNDSTAMTKDRHQDEKEGYPWYFPISKALEIWIWDAIDAIPMLDAARTNREARNSSRIKMRVLTVG